MPCPVHLSTASARTQQVMIASCRSGSASPATQAASAGCSAWASEQTHPAATRSTSTPTGRPATATITMSPEWVSENAGAGRGPGSRTGFPGAPQCGHRSRPSPSWPGGVPV